jgi:hypothetical protein
LPGILCEHLASVRGQEGSENLVPIFLRWLDFAIFEGGSSPAIEGPVFCRAGRGTLQIRFADYAPMLKLLPNRWPEEILPFSSAHQMDPF